LLALQLECPLVILGYEDDARSHAATVTMYAMLKPPSIPPLPTVEVVACGESEDIARHVTRSVLGVVSAMPV
jgi:hypothetical protein